MDRTLQNIIWGKTRYQTVSVDFFLHINKTAACNCKKKVIYQFGLFDYHVSNYVYSIFLAGLQKDHLIFYLTLYLTHILISSVGLAVDVVVMLVHVKRLCILDNDTKEEDKGLLNSTGVHTDKLPQERIKRVQEYHRKARKVIVYYVLSFLGEFLIYPTFMCLLYKFINETIWQFDDTISTCKLALLLHGVVIHLLHMNFFTIIIVVRVARAAYAKYDELLQPTEMEWKRYFTPVYLIIPFAILTALTHWFMIGIIGVRIFADNFTPNTGSMREYADNFTLDKDDTNYTMPDTGDYKVAPFTGYMIACTVYLPIVSWITYIILNKSWFIEVYSAVNHADGQWS